MKNIFYIIILVSSITMYSQNPISGFVEYTIVSTLAPDTLKISKNKKLQDLLTKEAYFKLNFTNKASLYQHKGTEKMASDTENAIQISFLKSFGGGDGIFYYHRDDKTSVLNAENAEENNSGVTDDCMERVSITVTQANNSQQFSLEEIEFISQVALAHYCYGYSLEEIFDAN